MHCSLPRKNSVREVEQHRGDCQGLRVSLSSAKCYLGGRGQDNYPFYTSGFFWQALKHSQAFLPLLLLLPSLFLKIVFKYHLLCEAFPNFPYHYLLSLFEVNGQPHFEYLLCSRHTPRHTTDAVSSRPLNKFSFIFPTTLRDRSNSNLKDKFIFVGGLRTSESCHVKSFFLFSMEKMESTN